MKRISMVLMALGFVIICSSGVLAQDIMVSNITSPSDANGVYLPNGDLNGHDSWKHEGSEYYIYFDDFFNSWNIDDDISSDAVLFWSYSAASPLEVSYWGIGFGLGSPVLEKTTSVIDEDDDGFNSSVDCDDNDASINPGVKEIGCDGIDNNCNGAIDEPAYNDGVMVCDANCDGNYGAEECEVPVVPEFGFFLGMLTMISAVGIFFFVRKD